MTRLAAALALAAVLALAPQAAARGLGLQAGPQPYHAATSAPTGLHAFLLRPDEPAAKYFPRTPSFAWNPVGVKGGTYEFELATSRTFNDAAVLFSLTSRIPALSIDHQLPWMTGTPYALWAHVRWTSSDRKRVTPWSDPFGFNMRWTDEDYPQQLSAPPGLVRWKPIDGATGYEVLYPDWKPAVSYKTTTNVGDEREFFTLHESFGWSTINWRVRAIRYINDKDLLKNGLKRVSYGPWSKPFQSVNPPTALGALSPSDTVSDTWDKKGQTPQAHELTPAFAWGRTAPVLGDIGAVGSPLYRVYIFTDDHCVNRVFTGSVVGSPAFAPRTVGGPLKLPQGTKLLQSWMNPPYITEFGDEGGSFDATGELLTPNEKAGQKAGDSATNASGSSLAGTAGVDLWDSGWPTGRYYWTVVPVIVQTKGIFDAKSDDQPIEYQDAAIPQDQCERGLGMSFGKVSSPVVTAASDMPYVAGLAPSGRYVAAASRKPEVHDSPLIAWQPAVGATQYEVQVSRKSYPWVPVKRLGVLTYSTATVLKLGPRDTGVWFYRVRGINPALPDGAQAMSWSKPVQIKITGDQFVVVK